MEEFEGGKVVTSISFSKLWKWKRKLKSKNRLL
jgi:hypothetical protein